MSGGVCNSPLVETASCNVRACNPPCEFGTWSNFSACTPASCLAGNLSSNATGTQYVRPQGAGLGRGVGVWTSVVCGNSLDVWGCFVKDRHSEGCWLLGSSLGGECLRAGGSNRVPVSRCSDGLLKFPCTYSNTIASVCMFPAVAIAY